MKTIKLCISAIFLLVLCSFSSAFRQVDPLSSWNDGPAKQAIIDFVKSTTGKGSSDFVPLDERIAVFDQDGTLWVEKPIYTQTRYCLDRISVLARDNPGLKNTEPFKTVLKGSQEAVLNLSLPVQVKIIIACLTGMPVEVFQDEVRNWITTAKNNRWNRLYTQLAYLPMLEVLHYLRSNGYKTYIATGGSQDFVRVYAKLAYGIPPEQVIGTATEKSYRYDKNGEPFLRVEPRFLFYDNYNGKPKGIQLMIGRHPYAAFGNSIGDREMLEYTYSGKGKRLAMLVLHDDAEREYAYGPAKGLPDSKVGTFTQALYDEAKKKGWVVISMKNDWKRIFSFE